MLALIVALAAAGCGGDEDEASTTAPTTPHASTTPTKPDSTKSGSKKSGSKSGSNESGHNASGSSKSGSNRAGSKKDGSPEGRAQTTPEGGTPVGTVPRGGGPDEDEQAVVRTVRAYLVAIARGDGPQACAQLTPEGQHAVERKVARAAPETKGSPCDASIALYQNSYRGAAGGVRVTDVSVAGDRAKAVALHEAASLVKHGRTWLIARYRL